MPIMSDYFYYLIGFSLAQGLHPGLWCVAPSVLGGDIYSYIRHPQYSQHPQGLHPGLGYVAPSVLGGDIYSYIRHPQYSQHSQVLHPGLGCVAPSVLGGVSISSFYSNLSPFSQIREIGIICWRRCVWDSMSDAILSEQMFSTLPTRAPSAVCLDAVLCMLMTPQRLL